MAGIYNKILTFFIVITIIFGISLLSFVGINLSKSYTYFSNCKYDNTSSNCYNITCWDDNSNYVQISIDVCPDEVANQYFRDRYFLSSIEQTNFLNQHCYDIEFSPPNKILKYKYGCQTIDYQSKVFETISYVSVAMLGFVSVLFLIFNIVYVCRHRKYTDIPSDTNQNV